MEEDTYLSDDSYSEDEGKHSRLLDQISKLDARKRIKPSVRREPSLNVSEFHLTHRESPSDSIQLQDLAKTLARSGKGNVAKSFKAFQQRTGTLPKPLEKHQANLIQREVGYENVKSQLDQWESIVQHNRAAETLVFPLPTTKSATGKKANDEDFLKSDQLVTELEREIAKALNGAQDKEKNTEEKDDFPVTLGEMMQRRNELAQVRAQQSYRQSKARRQNKIKSKKFHRIARRERMKQQVKEFEELQQRDPEAALRKLEQIEKEHALERASLRHRSTGQWARNKAVRAKYDKESRQVLSEQLKLSRDLTQKVQVNSESGTEDEEDDDLHFEESSNPFIGKKKTESEIDDFLSGYRKYWEEKNKRANNVSEGEKAPEESVKVVVNPVESYQEKVLPSQRDKNRSDKSSSSKSSKNRSSLSLSNKSIRKTSSSKNRTVVFATHGKWNVIPIKDNNDSKVDIDDLFEDMESSMSKRAQVAVGKIKKILNESGSKRNKNKRKEIDSQEDSLLKMKRQRMRPDIDEELESGIGREVIEEQKEVDFDKSSEVTKKDKNKLTPTPEIDPHIFPTAKVTRLRTEVPDELCDGEDVIDDEEEERRAMLTISEAFADDELVEDFSKEKEEEIERTNPKDIDLTLPGWGEWGGHNVKISKRKRRRFIIKAPEHVPRRDENKLNVFINQDQDKPAKPHQVNEIPFPFTSVKDFEASVRAPITNTFIPETAHRKLTTPAVRTKMGNVIEPISKDVLIKSKR